MYRPALLIILLQETNAMNKMQAIDIWGSGLK